MTHEDWSAIAQPGRFTLYVFTRARMSAADMPYTLPSGAQYLGIIAPAEERPGAVPLAFTSLELLSEFIDDRQPLEVRICGAESERVDEVRELITRSSIPTNESRAAQLAAAAIARASKGM